MINEHMGHLTAIQTVVTHPKYVQSKRFVLSVKVLVDIHLVLLTMKETHVELVMV
jgi:hypothetical protein